MTHFLENSDIFSSTQFGFRKNMGTEAALLNYIDYIQNQLNDFKYTLSIFMDLSKAFDCIPHSLLICKMKSYGVSIEACTLMASYLSDRKQRVKLQNTRSEWQNLRKGVPQGSILGPIIFNIFMNDIFYFIKCCELDNYADDNT